jgi:hypothetical protein
MPIDVLGITTGKRKSMLSDLMRRSNVVCLLESTEPAFSRMARMDEDRVSSFG